MIAPLRDENLSPVLDLVSARAGLSFPPARRACAETVIRKAMAQDRARDACAYAAHLAADAEAFHALLGELTVSETYFFREPDQFDVIRRRILPDILDRKGKAPLRVWSAGCASGEEPYSLAILFEEQGLAERAAILATDISGDALAKAKEALYGEWSLRGDDGRLASLYFARERGRLKLAPRFVQRVNFLRHNLAGPDLPEPGPFDLILCRNVLIYFGAKAARDIALRFHGALASGGWLVLGPSDPPLWLHAPFEAVVTPSGVFCRKHEGRTAKLALPRRRLPPPSAPRAGSAAPAPAPSGERPVPPPSPPAPEEPPLARLRSLAEAGDLARAVSFANSALVRAPFDAALAYAAAIVFLAAGKRDAAKAALRRVIYLDRSLAAAHFALGHLLARDGEAREARRAFRNARDLCLARPAAELVPLSDGDSAGRMAAAAARQLSALEDEAAP